MEYLLWWCYTHKAGILKYFEKYIDSHYQITALYSKREMKFVLVLEMDEHSF